MRYTIKFEREVVQRVVCTRVVEAESAEEAENVGHELASDFNLDCPDDATQDGCDDCQDWGVESVEETPGAAIDEDL